MDSQQGIKEMGQTDAMGFRDEAEEGAVAVKAPRTPLFNDFDARFVVTIE